jgi:hypothetical protein
MLRLRSESGSRGARRELSVINKANEDDDTAAEVSNYWIYYLRAKPNRKSADSDKFWRLNGAMTGSPYSYWSDY